MFAFREDLCKVQISYVYKEMQGEHPKSKNSKSKMFQWVFPLSIMLVLRKFHILEHFWFGILGLGLLNLCFPFRNNLGMKYRHHTPLPWILQCVFPRRRKLSYITMLWLSKSEKVTLIQYDIVQYSSYSDFASFFNNGLHSNFPHDHEPHLIVVSL